MNNILLFLVIFFRLVPAATPTPKPITLADMNRLYGPCVNVPVLMYHHIQDEATAKKLGQGGLTVTPEWFKKQMEYLKQKGYSAVDLVSISNYFDNGTKLPPKPIAITLDDAYEDNYLNAYPILREVGFKATIFTPTGLVEVPDYLHWNQINEMAGSGLVYFANHTWSHHGSFGSIEVLDKEISLADTQLRDRNLNKDKIFAYPYGKPSGGAEAALTKYGYKLAFTTTHGSIQCKGQRFELPRVRVGNAPLLSYGL